MNGVVWSSLMIGAASIPMSGMLVTVWSNFVFSLTRTVKSWVPVGVGNLVGLAGLIQLAYGRNV
jgi:hypothetical protein